MHWKCSNTIRFFIAICLGIAGVIGCTKEYSFEGGPVTDTIPAIPSPDTTVNVIPAIVFPVCDACLQIDNQPSTWRFRYGTSQLCGTVTNAVITPERNGFTFFGPSACSADTGLIITVFLDPESLNSTRTGITINQVAFEYYDNTIQSDIFVSSRRSFSLTIETYDHTTGIAKGKFTGNAKTSDSTVAEIFDGNFSITFPL